MIKTPLIIGILALIIASAAQAHSGRTDSNGGHNCSAKSKQKGLCTGYHYHAEDGLPHEDGSEVRVAINEDGSYKVIGRSKHQHSHDHDHEHAKEASI